MSDLPVFRAGRARSERGFVSPLEGGNQIPYAVIEGAQAGPTLLVTGGVHGSELSSIEAALRWMHLDPHRLRGTLVVIPILNITGFHRRSIYIMPEDGKNLNRQFPGLQDGSASQRLAFWLSKLLPQCDAYLDLHGGDLNEDLCPFVIFNEGDEKSKQLALASGFDIAVSEEPERLTSSAAAARSGVPSLTVEAGHNGLWSEESVKLHFNGVLRVLAHLGMMTMSGPPIAIKPKIVKLFVPVAENSGFWYPRQIVGSPIGMTAVVGEIRDVFQNVLAMIESSVSGHVLYQLTSLWVNAGEQLLGIAYTDNNDRSY